MSLLLLLHQLLHKALVHWHICSHLCCLCVRPSPSSLTQPQQRLANSRVLCQGGLPASSRPAAAERCQASALVSACP